MNTRLTTFALVTLATLGTACDPEAREPSVGESTFRGDEIDPPTHPTTGTFVIKGGHDDPEEWGHAFEEVSLETQIAFFKVMHAVAGDRLLDEFSSDEHNIEWATLACEERQMQWGGEFTVSFLHVEHGRVSGVEGEGGSWGWEVEAKGTAEITASCVP